MLVWTRSFARHRIHRYQRRTFSVPGVLQLGDHRLRRKSANVPHTVLQHILDEKLLDEPCHEALEYQTEIDKIAHEVAGAVHDAHSKLQAFRKMHGFGRAISAPQCNHHYRIVAMDLKGDVSNIPMATGGVSSFTLFNPRITHRSTGDTISLWDDCMSFPDLMARVVRNRTVSVDFEAIIPGISKTVELVQWCDLPVHLSELIQHEIDHLDGVLSVDRVEDKDRDIVSRAEWLANREEMRKLVDYEIVPTV